MKVFGRLTVLRSDGTLRTIERTCDMDFTITEKELMESVLEKGDLSYCRKPDTSLSKLMRLMGFNFRNLILDCIETERIGNAKYVFFDRDSGVKREWVLDD